MNKKNTKQGFTLVELSIVIVVIGLIIAGVIKGQEMINMAKLNAVVTQANGFKSAFASFQEKMAHCRVILQAHRRKSRAARMLPPLAPTAMAMAS